MVDTFDSRALRRTDCYGQRFMRVGTYRYGIFPAGAHAIALEHPYAIEVVARQQPEPVMRQHNVVVHVDGARFTPDEDSLTIEEGDLVLWNCPHATTIPFVIAGDDEFFDSSNLVNECGFSHAFGSPGEYRWRDAHGSGIGGVVRVSAPDGVGRADLRRWKQTLTKGSLVMIADGQADPAEVEIMMGQTVYFAVVKGPGITVTDARALAEVAARL
jgi:plastocyanin